MPKRVETPEPGQAATTAQQAISGAVRDAEELDEISEDATAGESVQMVLTAADRKRLLGRLAEFEVMLLGLPPLQQNFVMAYVTDPTDGAAAARKAGYSERRAAATCCDLLKRPAVAAAIALGEQLREDRTMLTSDRTLHEIAILAFSDITDFEFSGGEITTRPGVPEYATRAISSVEWTETTRHNRNGDVDSVEVKTKIRLWSKETALRMLAVYQKLLSGETGNNLVLNQTINDNRGQSHTHNHQHQTWRIGDRELTF